MKNSKEYAHKVQKLYRSLKRASPKVQDAIYEEPIDAIVYATISENMTEAEAQAAVKRFADHFVDWNDLRVSRIEEIIEVLGEDTPISRQIASTFNKILMAIFNGNHTISLKALKKMGKRPAKQALEELEGIGRFVVDYCMLTALQGHAIPVTKKMIEYLKNNNLVDSNADEQEIEGFLTRQISAANAYEFYALLRQESELPEIGRKRRTAHKAQAAK